MPRYNSPADVTAHLHRAIGDRHYVFVTDLQPVHKMLVDLYAQLVVAKVRETALGYGVLPCLTAGGRQFDASFLTVRRSGPAYRQVLRFLRRTQGVDRLPVDQDVFVMGVEMDTMDQSLFRIGYHRSPVCTNPSAN